MWGATEGGNMNDVRREKYQVMPALPAEDYEALKADIAARGVMVAIEVDEYGNILDGYNRIKVCRELGINDYPVVVRSGLSEAEKLTHARRVNLLRRHLSQGQRRQRGRRAARRPVPIGSPNRCRARRRPQNRRGCARSIGRNWGNSPVGENDRDGRQSAAG
jgi:hypothetical protein